MTVTTPLTDRPATVTGQPGDRPLTLDQAAAALGIGREAVRSRIRRGQLRAQKQGRVWMVWPEAPVSPVDRSLRVVNDRSPDRSPDRSRGQVGDRVTVTAPPPTPRPHRRQPGADDRDATIARLAHAVGLLTEELAACRREVAELRAQGVHPEAQAAARPVTPAVAVTPAPATRLGRGRGARPPLPWWRRWWSVLRPA